MGNVPFVPLHTMLVWGELVRQFGLWQVGDVGFVGFHAPECHFIAQMRKFAAMGDC